MNSSLPRLGVSTLILLCGCGVAFNRSAPRSNTVRAELVQLQITPASDEVATRYCGPFAAVTVLDYFNIEIDAKEVGSKIAASGDMSPNVLRDILRPHLHVATHTAANPPPHLEPLRAHLRAGYPAIALVRTERSDHYIVVTGFETDDTGLVNHWYVCDRYYGTGHENLSTRQTADEFRPKSYFLVSGKTTDPPPRLLKHLDIDTSLIEQADRLRIEPPSLSLSPSP